MVESRRGRGAEDGAKDDVGFTFDDLMNQRGTVSKKHFLNYSLSKS